jgi:hypothetical protein
MHCIHLAPHNQHHTRSTKPAKQAFQHSIMLASLFHPRTPKQIPLTAV